jgi:hypothetical protein
MGGPGSGRRKVQNGTNGHAPAAPRVTFAELFAKMPAAGPAPEPTASPSPIPASPAPAAPVAAPASTPPAERSGNRAFSDMAAYVATNVGVTVLAGSIRRGKHEPREVPQEDLDRCKDATADAFVRALGDAEVPWWAGLATAWGNLYLAMRVGAKPLRPAPASSSSESPASSSSESPASRSAPPPAPPSPLGQGPPPPRREAPPDFSRMPPEIPPIEITSS